jgi:protein-tyrosine-phosphatase
MSRPTAVEERARLHAALGDPARLTIVDELSVSDRSPTELGRLTGLDSNLLAHHLSVLESVGLIGRSRSSGDGRRRYVHLRHDRLVDLGVGRAVQPAPALFVCTANSARSQLACALWRDLTGQPATSAGTHPADRVHPGAVAAARRAGLDLADSRPRSLDEVTPPALVVTVCDRAHEELPADPQWLHWSVPDPVPVGTARAFDRTVGELRSRMHLLFDRRVA